MFVEMTKVDAFKVKNTSKGKTCRGAAGGEMCVLVCAPVWVRTRVRSRRTLPL